MPKEYLIQILKEHLYIELLLAIIAYSAGWLIYFVLANKILGQTISKKRLTIMVLIALAYSFTGKLLISFPYIIGTIGIITIMLVSMARIEILAAGWSALIVVFLGVIGDAFLYLPLALFGDGFANLLLNTVWGNIINAGTEMIVPGILIWMVPKIKAKLKFPLVPPVLRSKSLNIWGLLGCFILIVWVCWDIIDLYLTLKRSIESIVINAHFLVPITGLIGTGFCFYMYFAQINKERKREQREYQQKQEQEQRGYQQKITELNTRIETLETEKQQLEELQQSIDANSIDAAGSVKKVEALLEKNRIQASLQLAELNQIKTQLRQMNRQNNRPTNKSTNKVRQLKVIAKQNDIERQ